MKRTRSQSSQTPIVPLKYAGQWIAWNQKQNRIVASAKTFREAREAAMKAGELDPLLDKAPRANVRFVGSA